MKNTIEDKWQVGEGVYEGHRLVARVNVGARSLVGDGHYTLRIGIAVRFVSPESDGMPKAAEIKSLEGIEDMIHDYFTAKYTGVLCIILTTQGMREFIIYATADDIDKLIHSLSQRFPKYHFQCYSEPDTEWDVYQYWA